MRAPRNEATGTSGESEVLAQFERLGWAGVMDSRHDTGTDLYLRPRDARRYELGAVMGAQVKTGPSFFSSPERDGDGNIVGWWFTTDRNHFDYWLRHALPHIVILRDQENTSSYWIHVTPDRVVPAGRGAKILVPKSNTVDIDHNEALSDIALVQLAAPIWDGTAWTGAVHLSPTDEIRHALIVPRLIAPHPNLTVESVNGIEALAMQVLLRSDLERVLEPNSLPRMASDGDAKQKGLSLEDARESEDWAWRATAALHRWHYQGEHTDLLRLVERALTPAERAAATVLCCTFHFDKNDPDTALQVLQDALAQDDDYSPVDHAWLQAQRARALLEVGQHEAAFDLAMTTQRIHREAPSDVTAAAIAGACALTSFKATGWMKGDLASMIQRRDNPASWWRTQVMSYGLSAHLSEEFTAWSEDPSIRTGHSDPAHRQLLSAALLASCAGDQDGWRHATAALGQHFLTAMDSEDNAEMVAMRLTLLRRSGDSKATGRATRHIVRSGPTMAARIAANQVDLSRSTRTSALADIELVTAAGDVLEPEHADQICTWALATLRDPETYNKRVRPTFIVPYKIIDLLKSMVWVLSEAALHNVIDYFLNHPPITDDGTAQTLARLIHAIPEPRWTTSHRQRAAERKTDAAHLRQAYLRVAAPAVPESQEEVHRSARAGELIVLDAIDDVRTLPSDAVDALIDRLSGVIDTLIDNAAKGMHSVGSLDPGHALTLLNIWHPANARWDRIELLLSAPNVLSRECSGSLEILAIHGSQVSAEAKTQLAEHVAVLRDRVPTQDFFGKDEDIRGVAAEAFAALTDDSSRSEVVRELLSGDAAHRASCAHIVERFGDESETELLLALAGDASEEVRDAALSGLSKLVATGRASHGAETTLSKVLRSAGNQSASVVVARLTVRPQNTAVTGLLAIAAEHPSARIRHAVGKDAED